MKELKNRIQKDKSVPTQTKSELLSMLSNLESQVTKLSKTHLEHAQSIAGFIERSTHEATRKKKHPELLDLSLSGLKESVKQFEASHPQMVKEINSICTVLANMGV
jgi:hypothetical protein